MTRSLRLALMLPWLLAAPPAGAESIISVTATVDDTAGNGNCTLREAIIAATTDASVDACSAGSGADVIELPPGSYVLTIPGPREEGSRTGDLDIIGDIYIRGAGRAATIVDGGSRREQLGDRVFHVLSGGRLILSGVTVRGGYCASGGGILNAGWLSIVDSTVKDNVASEIADYCWHPLAPGGAGIYNLGELQISGSTLSGNQVQGTDTVSDVASPGGALLNRGVAVLVRSVVSANFAASGGGIRNDGRLHIVDSAVGKNGARFYGAGLHNTGEATLTRSAVIHNVDGGILNDGRADGPATLLLDTVTVSGNRSHRLYGSVHNWGGTVDVRHSTIAGNFSVLPPGGLWGPAALVNSLIANGPYGDCAGAITSFGHNLDTDGSCGLSGAGDVPIADPGLGPLGYHGGPTPTHALDADSAALDRISQDGCGGTQDQRGVPRPDPAAGRCDIGSYERSPAGDITLLAASVEAAVRQGLVDPQLAVAIDALLQAALGAIGASNTDAACAAIEEVARLIDQSVGEGTLDPATAGAWSRAVKDIRRMVCA